MKGFIGFLRPEGSTAGLKVVIIEIPMYRWPRVVLHPENYSKGRICASELVSIPSLKESAFRFIVQQLCFPGIIRNIVSSAIAIVHALCISRNIVEGSACTAGVIVKGCTDGPEIS